MLEDGEERGEVLAQVGAEPVAVLDAVPDGVLLGSGQDGDGLGEVAVGGQGAVFGGVGAQDVGQDFGVEVVGLLAAECVAVAVAGGGEWVDDVDRPAGGAQAGDQEPVGGLDGDRNRGVGVVAVAGQEVEELGEALGAVVDAELGEEGAGLVQQGDVVVVGGPVDTAEHAGHGGVLWLAVVCWSSPGRGCASS